VYILYVVWYNTIYELRKTGNIMDHQAILMSVREIESTGIFEAGLWVTLGYCFVFTIILFKQGSL